MTQKPQTRTQSHALELLRDEHRRMQELLDHCAKAEASNRKSIADNLVAEAQAHILLSHDFIFPAVERVTRDTGALEAHRTRCKEIDSLSEEMAEVTGEDERFQLLHDRMQKLIDEHVATEERVVAEELRRIGDEELVAMGQKMLARREEMFRDLTDETPRKPEGPGGDDI